MKRSRIILLALALFALGTSIASSVAYNLRVNAEIEAYKIEQAESKANGEMSFSGAYCYPGRHPSFLFFISALIAVGGGLLLLCKNAVWSFLGFLSAFASFPFWYWSTELSLSMAENIESVVGVDRFLYKASVFDLLSLTLLLSIITFQSSQFLLNIYSSQRRVKLP
jgi:hypothetical protein